MTYFIIFGNVTHKVHVKTWIEFLELLDRYVQVYGKPPDLIYRLG